MSWDAIIVGKLSFPKGGVDAWKALPAPLDDHRWPQIIARAADPKTSMYLGEGDPSVGEVLRRLDGFNAGYEFGVTEHKGGSVAFRYHVDGSNYSMITEPIVRLICAAADVGASGRFLFCDAGDAQVSAFLSGVEVVLEKGDLQARKAEEKLSSGDKKLVGAVLAELRARIAAAKGRKPLKAKRARRARSKRR